MPPALAEHVLDLTLVQLPPYSPSKRRPQSASAAVQRQAAQPAQPVAAPACPRCRSQGREQAGAWPCQPGVAAGPAAQPPEPVGSGASGSAAAVSGDSGQVPGLEMLLSQLHVHGDWRSLLMRSLQGSMQAASPSDSGGGRPTPAAAHAASAVGAREPSGGNASAGGTPARSAGRSKPAPRSPQRGSPGAASRGRARQPPLPGAPPNEAFMRRTQPGEAPARSSDPACSPAVDTMQQVMLRSQQLIERQQAAASAGREHAAEAYPAPAVPKPAVPEPAVASRPAQGMAPAGKAAAPAGPQGKEGGIAAWHGEEVAADCGDAEAILARLQCRPLDHSPWSAAAAAIKGETGHGGSDGSDNGGSSNQGRSAYAYSDDFESASEV